MPQFLADMHIHSRFSMATSKSLGPRQLAAWGAVKGLQVVATSDFTHPGWLAELEDSLEEEGNGLLRLRDPSGLEEEIPWLEQGLELTPPRFILCTEISSIYKRDGALRKIHNLVFFPGLDSVRRFNQRLDRIGNLQSDGRPILGLDSRDLLEIALETDERAFLIPAHIWTPWFSLFGSQSGFNSLKECFGSLSEEIFALETGLSSDPEMNWLWSELDGYRLVSNSDAHSGEKLAREANLFQGEVSYDNIHQALKHPDKNPNFLGTVEFFPEEGKYHLDGHRNCGIRLDPRETFRRNNVCPVCGKPVTVGVLNRVCRLADRREPEKPPGSPGYHFLIPLPEILSEILGVGAKTKKVRRLYRRLLQTHTSELNVLLQAPIPELKSLSQPLAEAVRRMRSAEVYRDPGYDGEFGVISAFSPQERRQIQQGQSPAKRGSGPSAAAVRRLPLADREGDSAFSPAEAGTGLNQEQQLAVNSQEGPLLVVAGPGTGKTRTLLERAKRLLELDCDPQKILVLAFTRAAARQLRQRLREDGPAGGKVPRVNTLHSLAYEDLSELTGAAPRLMPEEEARELFMRANPELAREQGKREWSRLALARETLAEAGPELSALAKNYSREKESRGLADYTDLLEMWLAREEAGLGGYEHLLLDEVQDLSPLQIRMASRLVLPPGKGLFAIGDPRQSIYGFRGAAGDPEGELRSQWPGLTTLSLRRNYRTAQGILDFSAGLYSRPPELISEQGPVESLIHFYEAKHAKQEAGWIAEQIKSLVGGTAHLQADQRDSGGLGPGDIAVLVRVRALLPQLRFVLQQFGLPCSSPETENFWDDQRVRVLLDTAASKLGLPVSGSDIPDCPDRVLEGGPAPLADHLQDRPELDSLFRQSRPFQMLLRAYQQQGGWGELISWIALEQELAQVESRGQHISLLTLHAAKGMEFEAVFLPGLEEGILPLIRDEGGSEPQDPEEERRLFYVGLTRARSRLYLSQAQRRQLYGTTRSRPGSRFLADLSWEGVRMARGIKRTVAQEKRMRLV